MIDRNPYAIPTANESPRLEHVLYWVWEREAMRIAKENGYEGELTRDPILKQYRFCNVRRRDDRVSRWIIENLLTPATRNDNADTWFIAAIARFINWPPTLEKLLSVNAVPGRAEDFNVELFCKTIDELTAEGKKAWTGAYMVRAVEAQPGKKAACIANYLQSTIDSREAIREAVGAERVENVVSALHDCYGFGTFMAGQVAADLTYVKQFADVNTWAPMGPGSQRGLNRLHGRPLRQSWKQCEFNEALINIRNEITQQLDIEDVTLHDVQNVMCEADKYWRVLYGEGRPRATYKSETAY